MTFDHKIILIKSLIFSSYVLFFSLDGKEPKDLSGGQTGQDYQKKSENSNVRVTSRHAGMKLTRTQYLQFSEATLYLLSARLNSQNFHVPLTGILTDFF
jgi:hypothetical protein